MEFFGFMWDYIKLLNPEIDIPVSLIIHYILYYLIIIFIGALIGRMYENIQKENEMANHGRSFWCGFVCVICFFSFTFFSAFVAINIHIVPLEIQVVEELKMKQVFDIATLTILSFSVAKLIERRR